MDEKIILLYNFLYNNNFNECYVINKIILGKIGMDDIKVFNEEDSLQLFNELIKSKFSYLTYDSLNQIIYLKRFSDSFDVTVKIQPYIDDDNLISNLANNDSLFSYLLSQLVLYKKTRHILLPIINFDIKYDVIKSLIKTTPVFQLFNEKIEYGEVKDLISVRVREQFFKSVFLKEYLENNECVYKELLFQVIHTLAVIQSEFTGFRHNNLTVNNILIYIKKDKNDNNYEFKSSNWLITNSQFDVKICNFEKSSYPKYYGIQNQRDTDVPFIIENNQYFDLHTFFNSLISLLKIDTFDLDTKKFLDKYIPPNLREVKDNVFYLTKNISIATPNELLNDPYFKEYKISKEKLDIIPDISYTSMTSIRFIKKDLKISKLKRKHSNTFELIGGAFTEKPSTTDKPMSFETHDNINVNKVNAPPQPPRPPYDSSKPRPPYDSSRPPYDSSKPSYDNSKPDDTETKEDNNIRVLDPTVGDNVIMTRVPFDGPKPKSYYESSKPPVDSSRPRPPFTKEPEQKPITENFESTKQFNTPLVDQDVPPGFIPLFDPDGNLINKILPHYRMGGPQPIQKIYNISLSDPLGNHSFINTVYEDVLPGGDVTYTFLTLNERVTIKKYIRNSILDKVDGEELSIRGGTNSLLSWIKIYDLNPYSIYSNPYDNIPSGFLLYRSAYPIRYNKSNNTLKPIPTSLALNIRIYKMDIGCMKAFELNEKITLNNFNQWRDIEYYNWVNKIIKNKISCNFINMILYVVDSKSKVGFDKLDMIKQKKDKLGFNIQKDDSKKINELHDFINKSQVDMLNIPARGIRTKNTAPLSNELITKKDKLDLARNSDKILIILTESPNTNIIKWYRKVYEAHGTIQKMTSTGYHNSNVWNSILFQLIYSCALMQEHNIYINNFNLENNIFIKDVQSDNKGKTCWLYQINKINYYVPNYGYILLIDSNYADLTELTVDKQYKINGSIYNDTTDYSINIKNDLLEMLSNISLNKYNCNELDDVVIQKIYNIKEKIETKSRILDVLPECFQCFFNDKIGSLITKLEKDNLSVICKPVFVEGNLMIRQRRYDEYDWVMFKCTSGLHKTIIYKENDKYIEKNVFPTALFSYPEAVLPLNLTIIEKFIYDLVK